MLNVKNRKTVVKNIVRSVTKNYKKINDLDSYIEEKIEDEFYDFKFNSVNFEKGIIYDKKFNSQKDNNINVVFDDFIGKSENLNVYNSCENATFVEKTNKSVNYINKIFYKKFLYNINCFINNLVAFDGKNIFLLFVLFFNNLISLLYNFFILFIFSFLNIINYIIFLLLKFFLFIKYKIFKKLHLSYLNLLLIAPIGIIKFLLISVKEFANLLAGVFNIANKVLSVSNKMFKNNIYSNIITDKVNRYDRSNEHKNAINKINKKAQDVFKEYNKENTRYFDHFKFTKPSQEILISSNMQNKAIKDYLTTLERIEIKKITKKIKKDISKGIKKEIYSRELPLKLEIIREKSFRVSQCEKISNKYLQKVFEATNIKENFIQQEELIEKGI